MPIIDHDNRHITCNFVYYGPSQGGKTTNLACLYHLAVNRSKGSLISLATQTDRTMYFDYLAIEFDILEDYKTRFNLYAMPGQLFYDVTRKTILRNLSVVDGVVFVADSQIERRDANIESLWNLQHNLQAHGLSLYNLPYVLQLNKRDLPNICSVEEMKRELVIKDEVVIEAVADKGIGVLETLRAVSRKSLEGLRQKTMANI
ncbi:MAG: GTPase domain-containing protein [Acidobacteriota bacterium]|nr:GTPase domain-containing protein [Blastocatellia bacterium]MDW8412195.1 GTPase domain-containing protein [Acidobacteriota bacterium]